jgi:hypothetical protein
MSETATTEPTRGPVFLISPTERLKLQVGETTFLYRRLGAGKRNDLVRTHMGDDTPNVRGYTAFELAVAQYCLRGWENLLDAEEKQVPFLEEVIEHLPLEVLQMVNALANETSPKDLVDIWRARQHTTTP